MHRNSRLFLFSVFLFAVTNGGCGDQNAEIQIQITKDDANDDFSDVNALRVIIRDLAEEEPEIYGPFPLDRENKTRLSTEIPPGHEFYVDVWACPSIDNCAPSVVLARGCSEIILVDADGTDQTVGIILYGTGTNNATDCIQDD